METFVDCRCGFFQMPFIRGIQVLANTRRAVGCTDQQLPIFTIRRFM